MTSPGSGAPVHADRLSSLTTLLGDTDEALRRGAPAGARVWPTGFPLLDQALTGGLRSGELALLGGSHGEGKTTIGLQMVRNAVAAGGVGVVFSYEHEAHTLLERLVSLEAAERVGHAAARVHQVRNAFEGGSGGLSLAQLLGGLNGGQEAYAALTAYGDRLHIHESSGATTTLDEVSAVIKRVAERAGDAPMVLLDYLQKVPMLEAEEEARITAVAEGLKDMALEIGSPIMAVSAADKDALVAGHRMRTHDLRGSSSLAYEADVVMLLGDKASIVSREHLVYDLGNMERFKQMSVLSLEKNRHGRSGMALEFLKDFEHGRFDTRGDAVSERLIDERVILS